MPRSNTFRPILSTVRFLLPALLIFLAYGRLQAAPAFTCTNAGVPLESNAAYTTTCNVTSGVAPFTWSISAGSLPTGVTQTTTPTSVTLTGPATVSGDASYTVQLSDATSSTATQAFNGTIAPAVAFTCTNNNVPDSAPYTTTCTVTGGTGVSPFTWSISAGALPVGVTSATTAKSITLSGQASVPGAASYSILLSDAADLTASQVFSGTIPGSLVANWTFANGSNLGEDTSGNGYNLTQMGSGTIGFDAAALGGKGAAIFSGSNYFNLGGASPQFPDMVPIGGNSYSIAAWINPGKIGAGAYGIIGWGAYGDTDHTNAFRTDGGNGVVNYSWGDDAEYDPSGLSVYDGNWHFVAVTYDSTTNDRYVYIDPFTSGLPPYQSNPRGSLNVLPVNFNVGITCTTCGGEYFVGEMSQLQIYNYALTPTQLTALDPPPALSITTTGPLPAGRQGTSYSGFTMAATGGSGQAVNYQWTSSTLPPGLSLDLTTGTITGTPAAAGTFTGVSITVTDTLTSQSASATFAISIAYAPLSITTTLISNGTIKQPYGPVTIAATGGSGTFNWTATGLPPGMSIDPTKGAIGGTPTASGLFSTAITVTDTVTNLTASQTYAAVIAPSLGLGTSSILVSSAAGSSSVVLSDSGAWTASSNDSFLHIATGSASGTGSAVVAFTYDAFSGTSTRSGTLTIAGLTLTVTQAGTGYAAPTTPVTLLTGLFSPWGVAADSSGNVYVANTTDDSNDTIQEWNAATGKTTTLVSSGLHYSESVAVDASGNVYIADSSNQAIKEWNVSTQQVRRLCPRTSAIRTEWPLTHPGTSTSATRATTRSKCGMRPPVRYRR